MLSAQAAARAKFPRYENNSQVTKLEGGLRGAGV